MYDWTVRINQILSLVMANKPLSAARKLARLGGLRHIYIISSSEV